VDGETNRAATKYIAVGVTSDCINDKIGAPQREESVDARFIPLLLAVLLALSDGESVSSNDDFKFEKYCLINYRSGSCN
jgi:hypothetical protein